MLLHIEPSAMVDLFENRPETAYDKPFVWLAADHVIDDTTPPRVDLVLTKAGELELGFSEEIDPQVASATILLDGETRTWTALPDGYTLKPAGAISATTHTLQIGPALIDRAGNSLAEPFTRNVTTGATDQIAYERPDPRITPTSTLDNLASFQGHITDPATGLVYMRNRWMDPEMGRFMSADPLGYRDGPSPYEALGGSPTSVSDPTGLFERDFHFDVVYAMAYLALRDENRALRIAFGSQHVDDFSETAPVNPVDVFRASFRRDTLRTFHFPDYWGAPVRRGAGNKFLMYLVRAAANGRSTDTPAVRDVRFGIALHSFGDSFAHEGFSWAHEEANSRPGFWTFLIPSIGHGEAFHSPDRPSTDVARSVDAAIAILRLIQAYTPSASPDRHHPNGSFARCSPRDFEGVPALTGTTPAPSTFGAHSHHSRFLNRTTQRSTGSVPFPTTCFGHLRMTSDDP